MRRVGPRQARPRVAGERVGNTHASGKVRNPGVRFRLQGAMIQFDKSLVEGWSSMPTGGLTTVRGGHDYSETQPAGPVSE